MIPTGIAIVDDHKFFRRGVRSILSAFPEYQIVFEASDGEECCAKMGSKIKPEIVILDLSMPVLDGYETTVWMKAHSPQTSVIILSMHEEEDVILKLVRAGVKGYILKDAEPEEFKQALDEVRLGGYHYPKFVTRFLLNQYSTPAVQTQTKSLLNKRETEFLQLVPTELTYKEIADNMNISVRTVDTYRDQLFEKLNVKSRVGLVLYAIKNNFVSF